MLFLMLSVLSRWSFASSECAAVSFPEFYAFLERGVSGAAD